MINQDLPPWYAESGQASATHDIQQVIRLHRTKPRYSPSLPQIWGVPFRKDTARPVKDGTLSVNSH